MTDEEIDLVARDMYLFYGYPDALKYVTKARRLDGARDIDKLRVERRIKDVHRDWDR